MISLKLFRQIYEKIPVESKIELFYKDNTYMIIKYDKYLSFQKCGDLNNQSGEVRYLNLDDLCNSTLIDGINLENDFHLIDDIVINGMDLNYVMEILGLKEDI